MKEKGKRVQEQISRKVICNGQAELNGHTVVGGMGTKELGSARGKRQEARGERGAEGPTLWRTLAPLGGGVSIRVCMSAGVMTWYCMVMGRGQRQAVFVKFYQGNLNNTCLDSNNSVLNGVL